MCPGYWGGTVAPPKVDQHGPRGPVCFDEPVTPVTQDPLSATVTSVTTDVFDGVVELHRALLRPVAQAMTTFHRSIERFGAAVAPHLEKAVLEQGAQLRCEAAWHKARELARTIVQDAEMAGQPELLLEARTLAEIVTRGGGALADGVEYAAQLAWLAQGIQRHLTLQEHVRYRRDPQLVTLLLSRHADGVLRQDVDHLERTLGHLQLVAAQQALDALVTKFPVLRERAPMMGPVGLFEHQADRLAEAVAERVRSNGRAYEGLQAAIGWAYGGMEIWAQLDMRVPSATRYAGSAARDLQRYLETANETVITAATTGRATVKTLTPLLQHEGTGLGNQLRWLDWIIQMEGLPGRAVSLPVAWEPVRLAALESVAALRHDPEILFSADQISVTEQRAAMRAETVLEVLADQQRLAAGRTLVHGSGAVPGYARDFGTPLTMQGDGGPFDPSAGYNASAIPAAWRAMAGGTTTADRVWAEAVASGWALLFAEGEAVPPIPAGLLVADAQGIAGDDAAWHQLHELLAARHRTLTAMRLPEFVRHALRVEDPHGLIAARAADRKATAQLLTTFPDFIAAWADIDLNAHRGTRFPVAWREKIAAGAAAERQVVAGLATVSVAAQLFTMAAALGPAVHPAGSDKEAEADAWGALAIRTLFGETRADRHQLHRTLRAWAARAREAEETLRGDYDPDPEVNRRRRVEAAIDLYNAALLVKQLDDLRDAAPIVASPFDLSPRAARGVAVLTTALIGPGNGGALVVERDPHTLRRRLEAYERVRDRALREGTIAQQLFDHEARFRESLSAIRQDRLKTYGDAPTWHTPDPYAGAMARDLAPRFARAREALDKGRLDEVAAVTTYLDHISRDDQIIAAGEQARRSLLGKELAMEVFIAAMSMGGAQLLKTAAGSIAWLSDSRMALALVETSGFVAIHTAAGAAYHGEQDLLRADRSFVGNVAHVAFEIGTTALQFGGLKMLMQSFRHSVAELRATRALARGIPFGGRAAQGLVPYARGVMTTAGGALGKVAEGTAGLALELAYLHGSEGLRAALKTIVLLDPQYVHDWATAQGQTESWGQSLGIILGQRGVSRPLRPMQERAAQWALKRRLTQAGLVPKYQATVAQLAATDRHIDITARLLEAAHARGVGWEGTSLALADKLTGYVGVRERLAGELARMAPEAAHPLDDLTHRLLRDGLPAYRRTLAARHPALAATAPEAEVVGQQLLELAGAIGTPAEIALAIRFTPTGAQEKVITVGDADSIGNPGDGYVAGHVHPADGHVTLSRDDVVQIVLSALVYQARGETRRGTTLVYDAAHDRYVHRLDQHRGASVGAFAYAEDLFVMTTTMRPSAEPTAQERAAALRTAHTLPDQLRRVGEFLLAFGADPEVATRAQEYLGAAEQALVAEVRHICRTPGELATVASRLARGIAIAPPVFFASTGATATPVVEEAPVVDASPTVRPRLVGRFATGRDELGDARVGSYHLAPARIDTATSQAIVIGSEHGVDDIYFSASRDVKSGHVSVRRRNGGYVLIALEEGVIIYPARGDTLGRRVAVGAEVPLAPGDAFMVGRVMVQFAEEVKDAPVVPRPVAPRPAVARSTAAQQLANLTQRLASVETGDDLIALVRASPMQDYPINSHTIPKARLLAILAAHFPKTGAPQGALKDLPEFLRETVRVLRERAIVGRATVHGGTRVLPIEAEAPAPNDPSPILFLGDKRLRLEGWPQRTRWTIGRDPNCDLVVPQQYGDISRVHGVIEWADGVFWIRDMGATNPIRVGGVDVPRHGRVAVSPGTTFEIGSVTVGFVLPPQAGARSPLADTWVALADRIEHLDFTLAKGRSAKSAPGMDAAQRELARAFLRGEPVYLDELTRAGGLRDAVEALMGDVIALADTYLGAQMRPSDRRNPFTGEYVRRTSYDADDPAVFRLALMVLRAQRGEEPLPPMQPAQMRITLGVWRSRFPRLAETMGVLWPEEPGVGNALTRTYTDVLEAVRHAVFDPASADGLVFWRTATADEKRAFLKTFFGPFFHRDIPVVPGATAYEAGVHFIEGAGQYGAYREVGLNLYLQREGSRHTLVPRLSVGEPGRVAGEGGDYFHRIHTHPEYFVPAKKGLFGKVPSHGDVGATVSFSPERMVPSPSTLNIMPSCEAPGIQLHGDLDAVVADAARYEAKGLHVDLPSNAYYSRERDLYTHDVIHPNGRSRILYHPARAGSEAWMEIQWARNPARKAEGVVLNTDYKEVFKRIKAWGNRHNVRIAFVERGYEELQVPVSGGAGTTKGPGWFRTERDGHDPLEGLVERHFTALEAAGLADFAVRGHELHLEFGRAARLDEVAKLLAASSVPEGYQVHVRGGETPPFEMVIDAHGARIAGARALGAALWARFPSITVDDGAVVLRRATDPKAARRYSIAFSGPVADHRDILREYLAYEMSRQRERGGTVQATRPAWRAFWEGALRQAEGFGASFAARIREAQARRDAGAVARWREQYAACAPYLHGPDAWQAMVETMLQYKGGRPAQAPSLDDLLDRVQQFSDPPRGAMTSEPGFEGRGFDDNAFALASLFRDLPPTDLPHALRAVQELLGAHGGTEVYGAVVGLVYKVHTALNQGRPDTAALHELDSLRDLVNTPAGRRRSRVLVLPRDRTLAVLTPEWIVQQLDSRGHVVGQAVFEVKNIDAVMTFANGSTKTGAPFADTVRKAVDQVTSPTFAAHAQGFNGVLVLKFYRAHGLEGEILAAVERELGNIYADAAYLRGDKAQRRMQQLRQVRVYVTCEDTRYRHGAQTTILTFQGSAGTNPPRWTTRPAAHHPLAPRSHWAVGWSWDESTAVVMGW